MEYRYITLFDITGFVNIIDISNNEQTKVELIMNNENTSLIEKKINQIIISLINDAKNNSHKFPEVWLFWSEFTREIISDFAQKSPQELANVIRQRGECIFEVKKPSNIII
jgi:hypothetical protein